MAAIDLQREALPQDLGSYKEEARSIDSSEFESRRPHPFLLYARSSLWDTALISEVMQGQGGETRVVDYNLITGGMSFLAPIRKLQGTDEDKPVYLGRIPAGNDVVVPVPSVSSKHAEFFAPTQDGAPWGIMDLGSRNGTYIQEDKLAHHLPKPINDGQYLRLGGNLIAWFLSPTRLWQVLQDEDKLAELINL